MRRENGGTGAWQPSDETGDGCSWHRKLSAGATLCINLDQDWGQWVVSCEDVALRIAEYRPARLTARQAMAEAERLYAVTLADRAERRLARAS